MKYGKMRFMVNDTEKSELVQYEDPKEGHMIVVSRLVPNGHFSPAYITSPDLLTPVELTPLEKIIYGVE
jgi:hypothetical protein